MEAEAVKGRKKEKGLKFSVKVKVWRARRLFGIR